MASIQAVEREGEFDSISPENIQEIPPTQNTNPDSVSLKVDPDSGSELPTGPLATKKKQPLRFIILCFVFVCLAPIIYACVTVATFAILPLILAAFVVVRLLQFVVRCEVFEQHMELKILLRYWIFVVVVLILLEVGIFYPIAKYVPGFKLVMIIGLPITKWIKIICILIGIYLINQVFWLSIAVTIGFATNYDGNYSWGLVLESASEIFGCLLFLWAEVVVMNSVPTFKQSKIFGVYTRKWIKVTLFVLIGYNIITLLTHIFVWSLPKIFGDHFGISEKLKTTKSLVCCNDLGKGAFNKKYVVYVAIGIKRSIIFILSAVMLLLTWVLYFDDHLNTTPNDKKILKFGTWSLVSFLICSILWLIKSCILLYWEAHSVYNRLHSKIRDIGKQLYFLVLLSYVHYEWVFERIKTDSNDSSDQSCCSNTTPKKKASWVLLENGSEGEVLNILDRKTVKENLISHIGPKASIIDIQQAAEQILTAQYALSKEGIPGDLHHLQSDDSNHPSFTEILKKILQDECDDLLKDDGPLLLQLFPGVKTVEDLSFKDVKTWMERAHSRCRSLANTLISEKEVAKILNQVIIGLIIGLTFILWLLLSGLAKTEVLVLIASPFLAATFVFGDTAKSLFQGLMFVYVVHPFDVGDLCDVDQELLEVKRIGVWSTTFSKVRTVGKQEEVIYPNSDLATKHFINHKGEFDWKDYVEFSLNSPEDEITKELKRQIKEYLDNETERFIPNFHSVEIVEIGDKDKVAVHFKHHVKPEGQTYFECLKEKEERKSNFALFLRNLLNKPEFKPKNSDTSVKKDQEVTGDE